MSKRIPRKSASSIRLALTAVLAVLASTTSPVNAQSFDRPDDFGKHWVRQNPFTLNGMSIQTAEFDIKRYQDASFTSVLVGKPRVTILEATAKSEMPWHGHLYAKKGITEEVQNKFNNLVETYPGVIPCLVNDETTLPGMPITAEAIAWLHHTYPDMLAYCNAFPMGGDG